MSKTVKILTDEHKILFDLIEAAERLLLFKNDVFVTTELKNIIPIIEIFVDTFHHPKEEAVLYPLLVSKKKSLDKKIIKEISTDHSSLEKCLDNVKKYINSNNTPKLRVCFLKYLKLMRTHIWRENIIILINVSYLISANESNIICKKFNEIDAYKPTKKKVEAKIKTWIKNIVVNKKYTMNPMTY